MNVVLLIGRLTRDPELRYLPGSGNPVATFALAVDREYTGRDGETTTDFFNIQVWGKSAENCANHLAKGRLVAVRGSIRNRSYETQTGEKRYVTEINADRVQFLEWGDKGAARPQNNPYSQERPQNNYSQASQSGAGVFEPVGDDAFNPKTYTPQGLDAEGYKALEDDDVPF